MLNLTVQRNAFHSILIPMTKEIQLNMDAPLFKREDPDVQEAILLLLKHLRTTKPETSEDQAWELYQELRRKNEPRNKEIWAKYGDPNQDESEN